MNNSPKGLWVHPLEYVLSESSVLISTNSSAKPEEHGVQNESAIAIAIASLTDSSILFDSLGNILDYCLRIGWD